MALGDYSTWKYVPIDTSGDTSEIRVNPYDKAVWAQYSPADIIVKTDASIIFETKESNMRGLFEVFVIDPESGEILLNDLKVAKSAESAKFKALQVQKFEGFDFDDLDVIVRRIGDVQAKKEVQEVRVIKE